MLICTREDSPMFAVLRRFRRSRLFPPEVCVDDPARGDADDDEC